MPLIDHIDQLRHIRPHEAVRILCRVGQRKTYTQEIFFVHDLRTSRVEDNDLKVDLKSPIVGVVIVGDFLVTETRAIENFLAHLRTMRSGNV